MSRLKFIDFFSGIGGFRTAFEQAGHECVGHCEIDKFADKSYRAIHDVKEGEFYAADIRTIRASDLPGADIWTGGFPCQDISIAGKQLGFAGKRSSLFFTITSLIEELEEEDRPSYIVLENVKNLLSVNRGFDFARLLVEMDKIGYDAEWDVLNTKEVLPQNRERIFIVGHFRGRSTRKVFPIVNSGGEVDRESEGKEKIKIIGNIKPKGSTRIGIRDVVYSPDGLMGTLLASEYKQPKQIAVKQIGNIVNDDNINFKNPQRGRVFDPSGISPALNTCGGGNLEPKVVIPCLTPDRKNKRQNGRRFKENNEEMFTLTAQDRHGVVVNNPTVWGGLQEHQTPRTDGISPCLNAAMGKGGGQTPVVEIKETIEQEKLNGIRIRKLTPLECWRLQGFTDDQFYKAAAVNSNSQLYKQAGNSVSVPVVYEIARRIEIIGQRGQRT